MLMLGWNGTAWTRVPTPYPGPYAALLGVTAVSSSNVWAVGGTGLEAVILRWNGQRWTDTLGQLSPAAASASSAAVVSAAAVASAAAASSPPSAAAAAPSPASSAGSSPGIPPREQAAQALSVLLAQSGTDRAAVTQAVHGVADCSPGLNQDETVFSTAASSRQTLLGELAALPDRSALPAAMLQDLTTGWQVSGEADQDFAKWAQDEISQGCSTNYQSDPGYQTAMAPDDQATKDKRAFAALWTAVADEYGLPVYRYNQI